MSERTPAPVLPLTLKSGSAETNVTGQRLTRLLRTAHNTQVLSRNVHTRVPLDTTGPGFVMIRKKESITITGIYSEPPLPYMRTIHKPHSRASKPLDF